MPKDYMKRYATKRYVNNRINETMWSSVQRVTVDIDNIAIGTAPYHHSITGEIADHMQANDYFTRATKNTDGDLTYATDYKIEYIRLRIRCALGENEELSAVSQTVRTLIWRSITTINEVVAVIVTDVDGSPRYDVCYGDLNGLWYDKWKYVHSWAVDSNTTAGGQVFFTKRIRPLHSDTILFDGDKEPVDNSKGTVTLTVLSDDPDGVNASIYGYLEIGYVYLTE